LNADHDWPDATMDAIALVELAGSGDEAAARAILKNCDSTAVITRLARLLAALVNANVSGEFVCAECFREWSLETMRRP
jgi:hypothetical protein